MPPYTPSKNISSAVILVHNVIVGYRANESNCTLYSVLVFLISARSRADTFLFFAFRSTVFFSTSSLSSRIRVVRLECRVPRRTITHSGYTWEEYLSEMCIINIRSSTVQFEFVCGKVRLQWWRIMHRLVSVRGCGGCWISAFLLRLWIFSISESSFLRPLQSRVCCWLLLMKARGLVLVRPRALGLLKRSLREMLFFI